MLLVMMLQENGDIRHVCVFVECVEPEHSELE